MSRPLILPATTRASAFGAAGSAAFDHMQRETRKLVRRTGRSLCAKCLECGVKRRFRSRAARDAVTRPPTGRSLYAKRLECGVKRRFRSRAARDAVTRPPTGRSLYAKRLECGVKRRFRSHAARDAVTRPPCRAQPLREAFGVRREAPLSITCSARRGNSSTAPGAAFTRSVWSAA
jgi:hypothetical protein